MIHILDRLTTILQTLDGETLDGDVRSEFWSDLHTSYYTRCPFSGKTMQTPVMDADGICYEKDMIYTWLSNPKNTISPVSGKSLTIQNLLPNRSVRDMIELIPPERRVETEKTNFDLIDFRYQFVLYWFCKLNSKIHPNALSDIHRRITLYKIHDDKWWPVVNDKDFVCELTWTAFPRLRQMVYGEFVQIVHPDIAYNVLPTSDHNLKQWAKYCMVDAMKRHFNESKASQIDIAVDTFRSSNGYRLRPSIDSERNARWCKAFDIKQTHVATRVIPVHPPSHQNSSSQSGQYFIDMSTPQIAYSRDYSVWPSEMR
jgi:hypothetical protein